MADEDILSRAVRDAADLFQAGSRVLAAVSGGPDSVFLSLLLSSLAKEKTLSFAIAYIHHGLRKEADREQAFVRQLARTLGVPFHSRRIRVSASANVEERGRILRYRALAEIAQKAGYDAIVTGHQQDDQAETVLMNLLRGSGLRGLAAMRQVSPCPVHPGIPLVRPLLGIRRTEIEGYLRQRGIRFLTDRSNRSLRFFRNRLRLEVLPLLEKIVPSAAANLARTASLIQDDYDLLSREAATAFSRLRLAPFSCVRLSRQGLNQLHPSLSRLVIRVAIEMSGSTRASFVDIERIRLAAKKEKTARFILKHGVRAAVTRNAVVCVPCRHPAPPPAKIALQGTTCLPAFGLEVDLCMLPVSPAIFRNEDPLTAYFSPRCVTGKVSVRYPEPKDAFHPMGSRASQKLSRFLRNAGFGKEERLCLPLLVRGRNILWVIGVRQSEYCRVAPSDTCAVRCRVRWLTQPAS